MRITFVLSGYPWVPVGGFRVVYELANQLAEKGHEAVIVHPRRLPNWTAPSPPGLFQKWKVWGARKLGRVIKPRVRWQRIDPRVEMLYVPEPTGDHIPDADAVFATWWATAELVADYPASKGLKHYLIQHYETWGGPDDRVVATWRLPLRKVVFAKWLYEKGLELGVNADSIVQIPQGVNHAAFCIERPLEDRPDRVAMLYSDLRWKGAADGIQALEQARKDVSNLQATLFGVTARPGWLPRWIDYLHNPPQEELVQDIYNRSRVYLCPSWMEGWHLPPAEAMACGCALVSTEMGGVRDYAENEKTALLAPVRDVDGLARQLVRIMGDRDLQTRIAEAGNQRIQRFTWEESATALEETLMAGFHSTSGSRRV